MTDLERKDRPTLAPAVSTVLDALRRRIRRYIWLEGISASIAWLGVAFWTTLAVDWFFEPPTVVRGMMLLGILAGLAAVVFQLIGRRIFVRITDGNAATVLERRFPQLDDSLLTAVLLSECPAGELEIDPRMLAETREKAENRIAGIDLKQAFNPLPLRTKCIAAATLAFSIAMFAALFPESVEVWTRRVLALSEELWPRNTRLLVDGFQEGVQKVARGSDLEVITRADASMPQVPQSVEVRYRTDGGGRGRATMDRRGIARNAEDQYQEYAYTFRSILADVHFDVVGGDDRVADRWIQVVDSPAIPPMTLECALPDYIGRKPLLLSVSGAMQIPQGSRVTVHAAAANKELVQVQVNRIVDERPLPVKVLEQNDLSEDRRGFSLKLDPLEKDTTLLFTLTDTDGIRSRDPVRLVLTPVADQPPQMAVQLDGIGAAITALARIPFAGPITDDYGLARTWFEYAVDQQKPGETVIRDFKDRPAEFKLANAALEINALQLKPGQKLAVCVKADDHCNLGRTPNVSSSERWTLDVVTPAQLRSMLESRELVLRQRFERIVQEVTEMRDVLAHLEFGPPTAVDAKKPATSASADGDEPDNSPERQRNLRLLRVEGALSNCRKSVPEIQGVAESFDDIRKQLINNRIDTEELKNRLQNGIAEPLRKIVDPMFPELERRLEELQAALENMEKAPGLRNRAQQQTDDILLAMRKVLDRMIELENFNEAVELLRGIISSEEQLREQTQQRHKQKIRDLLKD